MRKIANSGAMMASTKGHQKVFFTECQMLESELLPHVLLMVSHSNQETGSTFTGPQASIAPTQFLKQGAMSYRLAASMVICIFNFQIFHCIIDMASELLSTIP